MNPYIQPNPSHQQMDKLALYGNLAMGQDSSPKLQFSNTPAHGKIKSISIRTDDPGIFNYSVTQNTPSSKHQIGQITPQSNSDLFTPKRSSRNNTYNFTNLLNSMNNNPVSPSNALSGHQSPNNRISMGNYPKTMLPSITESSGSMNLPLLRQGSYIPTQPEIRSYNQLDQEIEALEKKIKIKKLKSQIEDEEEEDGHKKKKAKSKNDLNSLGRMLSKIMIDESDDEDSSKASDASGIESRLQKLRVGKTSSIATNPVQKAMNQMTKHPYPDRQVVNLNTMPSNPQVYKRPTVINVVRSYPELDNAPQGPRPSMLQQKMMNPMMQPGMMMPQQQMYNPQNMMQQQMMQPNMQQQMMQHNSNLIKQHNPPLILPPYQGQQTPMGSNMNSNAGSPNAKPPQHQRNSTYQFSLKPQYTKSSENQNNARQVDSDRSANQSVKQMLSLDNSPVLKETYSKPRKENKEHKETSHKESHKETHKEIPYKPVPTKDLIKEDAPKLLFANNEPIKKRSHKIMGRYEPKNLLRVYLWGMLYVFLLKNATKKIVLRKRHKTMIELPKKLDNIMEGYIKKLVDKEISDEIYKVFQAKSYDFAFVKKIDSKKKDNDDDDDEFKVDPRIAYEPFLKHMQVILHKITYNTKRLPDDFFRFISTLTENGAQLPNKYFSHFELCRLPYSAFGALKGLKDWHSKVLIGGLVVVRMFIIGIIMKHILVIPYMKENKEIAMVVGSVMYQCTMDHLRSLAGINFETDKIVITGLKVAPVTKLETPYPESDLAQFPIKKQKNALVTDIIDGFYPKDMMPYLFKENTRMIEVVKSLIAGWIELIYERSHEIWLEDLHKKEELMKQNNN